MNRFSGLRLALHLEYFNMPNDATVASIRFWTRTCCSITICKAFCTYYIYVTLIGQLAPRLYVWKFQIISFMKFNYFSRRPLGVTWCQFRKLSKLWFQTLWYIILIYHFLIKSYILHCDQQFYPIEIVWILLVLYD